MKKLTVVTLFFTLFLNFPLQIQACENCPKKEGKQEACKGHHDHSKNCTGKECRPCGSDVKSKDDSTKGSKEESRAPNSEEAEDEYIEE